MWFHRFWASRLPPDERKPCVFIGGGPPGGLRGSIFLFCWAPWRPPGEQHPSKFHTCWASRQPLGEQTPCIILNVGPQATCCRAITILFFAQFGPPGGLRGNKNLVFSQVLVGPPDGLRGNKNLMFSYVLGLPTAFGATKALGFLWLWASMRPPGEQKP